MNIEVQPLLTIVVNLVVGLLVSKGIIDSSHAPMISQEINNVLAALVTLGLGIYSTHKVMDSYKHKVTVNAQVASGTPIVKSTTTTVPPIPSVVSQTGLPLPAKQ